MKIKLLLAIGMIFLSFMAGMVQADPSPLTNDQAFQLTVQPNHNNDKILTASWKIASGYYLYQNRIHFSLKNSKDAKLGNIIMPKGVTKQDAFLGTYEIYKHDFKVTIPYSSATQKSLTLLVEYQGCAASGFCYPPVTKEIPLDLNTKYTASTPDNISPPLSLEQNKISTILNSGHFLWTILLFFGFGVLLSFTPCVLPMIPILSGIIVGQKENISTKKALGLSFSYVVSMAVTYAAAGIVIALIGSNIQIAMQTPWVIVSFSLIFVVLAMSLFGLFEMQLPAKWQSWFANLSQNQRAGSYLGTTTMGCLSSLIVSPCITPPLVGALTFIGNTGNAALGGSALFAMGLGMGLPLLIIGTSFGSLLPKAGAWMNTIKHIFGVMMLALALWMLGRILSGEINLFLWGCFIIGVALWLGALSTMPNYLWGKIEKGIGIVFFIYGIAMIIGAAQGNTNLLQPLAHITSQATTTNSQELQFTPIKSLTDLKQHLASAQQQGKIVLLDFYADWCIACKEMDAETFSDTKVQQALTNFVLLRANVTKNDAQDQELEKYAGVIAPPSIIFFDKNGNEIKKAHLVGKMPPEKFLQYLNSF